VDIDTTREIYQPSTLSFECRPAIAGQQRVSGATVDAAIEIMFETIFTVRPIEVYESCAPYQGAQAIDCRFTHALPL